VTICFSSARRQQTSVNCAFERSAQKKSSTPG
jgi:hypothetical protein